MEKEGYWSGLDETLSGGQLGLTLASMRARFQMKFATNLIKKSGVFLSWLGRQGTRALAALVIIGIALPPIGALLKPLVAAAVFILLSLAFLRTDTAALKLYLGRPALVIAATAWTAFLIPFLFGLTAVAFGFKTCLPDFFLGVMLQAITSPMMAAPALTALMGLDATLVLITMLASTALIPFSAYFFTRVFIGTALTLSPWALGLKLLALIGGSVLIGFTIRRLAGVAAINRHQDKIDGLNIMVLFVFVTAVMGNVAPRFLSTPLTALALTAIAWIVFLIIFGLTTLVFAPFGRIKALSLGFMVSQRNMGLMLAATGGALPDLTWLYFALSQFPIYLSPHLFQPAVRRILNRPRNSRSQTADR